MSKGRCKNLKEGVERSRRRRSSIEARFGFMPLSVVRDINRGRLSSQMFIYQREKKGRRVGQAPVDEAKSETSRKNAKDRRRLGLALNVSGMPSSDRKLLSIMPAELVEFFVKYYAKPGDVYVDPFMGQGVQMQVAKLLGLHYYGYDLSEEFFGYISSVRDKIDDGRTRIEINLGDSRFPSGIPDGIGDFSFHSPPYWDIEFYGTEDEQLGHGQTYESFLDGMRDVARAWLPKFKSGAYHVVNVNDFRRKGRFYSYHADTIRVFCEAGWLIHDTWIIEGLVGGLSRIFAADKNGSRISPKVHEYALVFKAP